MLRCSQGLCVKARAIPKNRYKSVDVKTDWEFRLMSQVLFRKAENASGGIRVCGLRPKLDCGTDYHK